MSSAIGSNMNWDDIDLAVHEISVMSELVYEFVRETAYGEPLPRQQHDRAIVMAALVAEKLESFKVAIKSCDARHG